MYRLFNRVLQLRPGEATTAWLMFAFSFLAMTAHNIIKPLTRSKFIKDLGADNLPWVLLASGIVIGLLMTVHSWASGKVPRKAVIPGTLGVLIVVLIGFRLAFPLGSDWVPAAFYLFGLLFGLLLISQFWTLANDIYDPRQARRVFGFIGGGSSLGGLTGNVVTYVTADTVAPNNLLLVCSVVLVLCIAIVIAVLQREKPAHLTLVEGEKGVGGQEAITLLRKSKHLQLIALVIASAAVGAAIVEQQMNMAAEASKGGSAVDLLKFFALVGIYLSAAAFVIQVGLTGLIHRSLGLTFALLLLPVSLGASAMLILVTGALWASASARIIDTSFRYSLDKTTREVLFLPLPPDLKHRAKPFVDVTVDRFAKGLGALLALVLIKDWGLGWSWQKLSYASLTLMAVWIATALIARREYLRTFRKSLDAKEMRPDAVRHNVADPATIETLVEELANPDEGSVLYAIEMLETLDKRHLITPLLLHHESPKVRARALNAVEASKPSRAARWLPAVNRMLKDPDPDVRAAAVYALAAISTEESSILLQRYLGDPDPRISVTAAVELADSGHVDEARAAESALARLIDDTRAAGTAGRREAASALAHIRNPSFRTLLIPLIYDNNIDVAREAIASARAIGPSDAIFVPALVALLGHRVLKSVARDTLISYGQDVVPVLAHLLHDRDEQPWVRRHIPATLARMPAQASMDALLAALDDPDGFLRYKVIEAIGTLHRSNPELVIPAPAVEALIVKETARYYTCLTLRYNIVQRDAAGVQSLVVRALDDKLARSLDRVYRQLSLVFPWKDVAAARRSIEGGDARQRASALEYLDNLMSGVIRKRVMPIIDDMPLAERVRLANSATKTRPRDLDDTLAQLIHDEDSVLAASAIDLVEQRQIEALADDLEFVVKRGTADRLVLDAANWALASRMKRLATGKPDAHAGPLPVVELADRLRAIPAFSFVSVDELFRIAATARQVRHDRGRDLAQRGARANEVFFLLEGAVQIAGDGVPAVTITAPAALAFEDMLEDRPLRHTITAAEPVICLTLSVSEFLTMLSDNIVMAQGLFRMLLESRAHVDMDALAARTAADGALAPTLPLDAVEKALLLRQNPLLGRATVEQLLDLAAIAREVPLAAGAVLATERDAPCVFHVLFGEIRLENGAGPPLLMGPGRTIGVAETLSGTPPRRRATVTQAGHALRLDHDELFDVLSDHLDLLQGVFSGVIGQQENVKQTKA